ncbi:MAG: CPBP family intramembrane metalloprotease [Phototrophicales bacterium]|jgi:membrane protease YdiL (CAAX protease family)|nr:MAG: CPBP family intramembrane metalloprotease [Phototrophicales bacterium]
MTSQTYESSAHVRQFVKRHTVIFYFIITYTFSWTIGLLLIANRQGTLDIPTWLHYLTAFGPTFGAVFVTWLVDGRAGLADLWSRITRFRVAGYWWLIAVGLPILFALIAIVVNRISTGIMPDMTRFGEVDYLGDIGIIGAIALWIATYGFGEEIGWRGFAFHRLYHRIGFIRSALLIGILWGVWHLPFFLYKDNFMALGMGGFLVYIMSITMGSIVLSWLYDKSQQSILIVAIWHALFDFVSASPIADGMGNMVISMIIVMWAISILRQERHVAS